jgi:hypothetical protein
MQSEIKFRLYAEIDRVCEDKPEQDRENAKLFIDKVDSVPVIQMTSYGVCLVWKRLCVVFEDGDIYFYRYNKDCVLSYEPVPIYENCFDFGILDINNDLHMEKCKKEVSNV